MNFLFNRKNIQTSLNAQHEDFFSPFLKRKVDKSRNIICQSNFDETKNTFLSDLEKPLFFKYSQKKNLSESQNFFKSSGNGFQNKKNPMQNSNFPQKSFSGAQKLRYPETTKQQVVSITYEEIGLFPRSFNRVFDRFFKQLFFDVENLVIQEYRFYRYLFLTTVKCLFILFFVPLTINFFSKNYLIRPITEYYWNTQNHEIFLNSYQQKQAFSEFKNFEEKIYFESFLFSENKPLFESADELFSIQEKNTNQFGSSKNEGNQENLLQQKNLIAEPSFPGESPGKPLISLFPQVGFKMKKEAFGDHHDQNLFFSSENLKKEQTLNCLPPCALEGNTHQSKLNFSTFFQTSLQKRLQSKIFELANHYNKKSIEAVTNFFADILSFGTLCFLLVRLEIQINITKSFLLEVFFGLDDSKKSLLILFLTDFLVGYHSPNIWELFFQTLFDHYGLPESQTTIFLLVATLPVLLDVFFKYLIFRHLNRASPATVATYHAMIE